MWGTTIKASRQERHFVRLGLEDFSSHHWCREGRRRERLRWGSRGSSYDVTKTFLKIDNFTKNILLLMITTADTRTWQPVKRFAPPTRPNCRRRKWSELFSVPLTTCIERLAFELKPFEEKKLFSVRQVPAGAHIIFKERHTRMVPNFSKGEHIEKNTNNQPLFFYLS